MAPSDQERQNTLIAVTIALTTISLIVVGLRVFARAWLIRKAGWDDWLICLAVACSVGYMVEILLGRDNNMGFPMVTLSMENMVNLMKLTLAIQVTYYVAIAAIKISILFMYLRFAVDDRFRQIVIGTIIFHVVFLFVCIVVVFTQCQPIAKFWDLLGTMEGSCNINPTAFFYFTSAVNIVTDIFILALPVKTLIGINRPLREKVALLCIFLVGTFAAITSVIRLHTIYDYTLADDPFRHSILVNLWSVIEINTGIICASVPALKALFTPRVIREATSRYKKSSGSHNGGGRGGGSSRLGIFSKNRGREKIEGSGHVDTAIGEAGPQAWNMETYPSKGIEVRTDFDMSDRRQGKDSETSSQECIVVRPDVERGL
ncbi:integral membrane protein [Plectosphaerella plurivora]|uniref:Integral membrane protein n=1 Tax=Plectosphaerella plurivora TaxID=936078 RepID=A0A9P8VB14_9PEZI|nr:integral membrane protein [Plectosphaerella plurivora]